MNILIAPDSYKECLSALRVAECMKAGLIKSLPDANFFIRPMADGGEGTVDALVYALNGERKTIHTFDMYRRPIKSYYGQLDDDTAVIEVANIIGMEVTSERNPYHATSYGVGDVIRQLIDLGFKKILVGLGGSLTNDGGAGLLEALGLSFIDRQGNTLQVNGGNLSEMESIAGALMHLKHVKIDLICDVSNVLCGETGATYIFGKQKGITFNEMEQFDRGIAHFADLLEFNFNEQHQLDKGAGAAGGIGYGLLMVGAEMMSGADYISDIVLGDLDMQRFDYVVTGEGKSDFQTKYGKLPICVAKRAQAANVATILISGGLGEKYEALYDYFLSIRSITDGPHSLEEAIRNAERLITQTSRDIGRLLKV